VGTFGTGDQPRERFEIERGIPHALFWKRIRVNLEEGSKQLEAASAERRRLEEDPSVVKDALDSTASGVIITDNRGSIKYANAAFLRMFEYGSKAEIMGRRAADLFASQEVRRFADVEAMIDKAKGDIEDFTVLKKDGSMFQVEATTSTVTDNEGREVGRMASFVDISERKRLEEALRESSEKIKLFAYSVSHDLKGPAVAIYGLTRRLVNTYRDALDDKGKRYCDRVLEASGQIALLAERINQYISAREASLNIEKIKPKEIVQMVKEEFAHQLVPRRITWWEPDVIPEIRADRLSFHRILRNLVENALKYGGDDLSEIRIGYDESEDVHIISVTDNGVGIETDDAEDIFGPFKRKGAPKSVEGVGLGLAIVKELAEQHAGKAWMERSSPKGVKLCFSISRNL
jgi:PAS domain S-box-containing protein